MTGEGGRDILPVGYVLHWYKVLDVLGRGGYGITYLAFDQNLHRKVAIKEYLPLDFARRESNDTVHPMTDRHADLYAWGLERFLLEARTLAKFNSNHIIRVLSVFEHNNTAYMVMEYEEGSDLSVIYQEKKSFSEGELKNIFIPILQGLALVHAEGFIHRDIKPANIFVRRDGSSVLLDFGSARQTLGTRTRALTSLVTAGYAPFEQYNESEEEQGPWTDIYGLGSTLYYCITGKKPADALKRGAGLIKQGFDVYQPLSNMSAAPYSSHFLRAVDHALMFHADARPQTALTWSDMLLNKVNVPPIPADAYIIGQASTKAVDDANVKYSGDTQLLNNNQHPTPVNNPALLSDDTILQPISRQPPVDDESTVIQLRGQQPMIQGKEGVIHKGPQLLLDIFSIFVAHVVSNKKASLISGGGVLLLVALSAWSLMSADSGDQPTIAKQSIGPVDMDDSRQPAPTETVHEARGALIAKLLERAALNRTENRIIAPENNNAVFHYRKVLELDKENSDANRGLVEIESEYIEQVKRHIAVRQWALAGRDLSYLKHVSTKKDVINELQDLYLQGTKKKAEIEQLLRHADRHFKQNRLTKPRSKNALSLYNKVLEIDPENQQARAGLDDIVDVLSEVLTRQLKARRISKAKNTLQKIASINSEAPILDKTGSQLKEIVASIKKVNRLLKTAKKDFIRGRIIKPKGNNSLSKYRRALKLDPSNTKAKTGIKRIYDYYVSTFNQYLFANEFARAEKVVATLSEIRYGRKRVAKLRAKIKEDRLTR